MHHRLLFQKHPGTRHSLFCGIVTLLLLAASPAAHASAIERACPNDPKSIAHSGAQVAVPSEQPNALGYAPLIVIGFMGGHIHADNLVHKEAQLARNLLLHYPARVQSAVFANHDGHAALEAVLRFLDQDRSGCLSTQEKQDARIVIYGHSWGASETVTLARRLNKLSIPVLLTVQVDSVQKPHEDDASIPPNVHEAVNFYQAEGVLHGRSEIEAMDPSRTTILGNFASSYRHSPVSCSGYPWYARAFMRPHIEIENDPSVWSRIQALIATRIDNPSTASSLAN